MEACRTTDTAACHTITRTAAVTQRRNTCITKALTVEAAAITPSAKAKIEAAGGKVIAPTPCSEEAPCANCKNA